MASGASRRVEAEPTNILKGARRPDPSHLIIYAMLVVWCLFSLFPLLWMVGVSLKPVSEPIGGLTSMIPQRPTLDNFVRVSTLLPLARNMLNSVIVATFGTLTTVFLSALAGFAFAKYNFPGKNLLFFLLIGTMLVPPEAGIVPTFMIMRYLGWTNNYLSLIVPRAATAIGIFYMRQYINSFPNEVMEQGRLDGCSEFRIFWNLVLPTIAPALAAWGTLAFIARWNDFMYPLLFMTSRNMYTLMVAISKLPVSESLSTPWPVIMAGSAIAVFPLVAIYLLLQRFQVSGLQLGAVKG
jgi:ABC-type glycerol-3-phosphate transport system permease component